MVRNHGALAWEGSKGAGEGSKGKEWGRGVMVGGGKEGWGKGRWEREGKGREITDLQ